MRRSLAVLALIASSCLLTGCGDTRPHASTPERYDQLVITCTPNDTPVCSALRRHVGQWLELDESGISESDYIRVTGSTPDGALTADLIENHWGHSDRVRKAADLAPLLHAEVLAQ